MAHRTVANPAPARPRPGALRPAIRAVVDERIDAMLAAGDRADLVADFALPVPSLVIALLLGVPPEDLELFQHNTTVGMSVGASEELTPIAIRATTVFRRENGTWKVTHRHGDPITSMRPAESVLQS